MKILHASDLHGKISAYRFVREVCKNRGVDVCVLSGDLTSYSEKPFEEEEKIRELRFSA